MKTVAALRSWHVIAMVVVVASLLVSCTSSTPVPTPTPTIERTAVPTPEPSPTPIPPTATSTPTITPTPKPSAKNLIFGTGADLKDGLPAPAKFAVGVPMIHAAIDVVGLPTDARIEWRLTRDGYNVFTDKVPVKQASGTITRTLFEDARHILPGDYRLVATVANQMVDGHFVVSGDQSAPARRCSSTTSMTTYSTGISSAIRAGSA